MGDEMRANMLTGLGEEQDETTAVESLDVLIDQGLTVDRAKEAIEGLNAHGIYLRREEI